MQQAESIFLKSQRGESNKDEVVDKKDIAIDINDIDDQRKAISEVLNRGSEGMKSLDLVKIQQETQMKSRDQTADDDDDDSAYETDQTERMLATQKLKKESKKQQKSILDGLDVRKSRQYKNPKNTVQQLDSSVYQDQQQQ